MAEMTIRMVIDPDTGKKNIVIVYHSDEDALPMEHEDEHRRLVDRLIQGGTLKAAELGTVVVERESAQPRASETREAERRSVARET
jgi:hypothetical protein